MANRDCKLTYPMRIKLIPSGDGCLITATSTREVWIGQAPPHTAFQEFKYPGMGS